MSLRLNQTPEAFKEFYGRNINQMPKLIAEGRTPLSVAGIMQRRLDTRNAHTDVKASWIDNYFDTGDAVVYHPYGRVKIVLDSQYLREMTPETKRNSGALILTLEQYDAMDGEEFKREKIGKTGDWMLKKDVKVHPVWRVLARDQELLNDYVNYIFLYGNQGFGYGAMIGVFLGSAQGNTPEMMAWCVGSIVERSDVNGRDDLDYDNCRLVGVAPEALSASSKGASNIKRYTMADVQNAVSELEALEKIVRPESLGKVRSLVSKL